MSKRLSGEWVVISDIAESLIEAMEDAGYTAEEVIPGCIQAIIDLANDDEQLLDEAANLLADGGSMPRGDS